jgi:hypothetical protein
MKRQFMYFLFGAVIAGLVFCTPAPLMYRADAACRLVDPSATALCLPLLKIRVDYSDETKLNPVAQFTDSFLLEAANGFLLYESMRSFKLKPWPAQPQKPLTGIAEGGGFSAFGKDSSRLIEVSKSLRNLAEACSVDIVILPCSCYVKQRVAQPKGFRDKSGPGYERPVSFSASTSFHLQIWSRGGQLLYERIGQSSTGKPILYSFLKKEKPTGDVVQFAKKMYAPPLIKSLYASIQTAMHFN